MGIRLFASAMAVTTALVAGIPAWADNLNAGGPVFGYDCGNMLLDPPDSYAYDFPQDSPISGSSFQLTWGGFYSEAGPLHYEASPSTVWTNQSWLRAPAGSGSVSSRAIAFYDESGGRFQNGYWAGRSDPFKPEGTWAEWSAHGALLHWVFIDVNGQPVAGTQFDASLQAVAKYAGDGSGAFVGFTLGCSMSPGEMDGFQVSSNAGARVYDYEKGGSTTYLDTAVSAKAPIVQNDDYMSMAVGDSAYVLGISAASDGITDGYFNGTAELWAREAQGGWKKAAAGDFTWQNYSVFRIRPTHITHYQIRYPGSGTYGPSQSQELLVMVRMRVTAKIKDARLQTGQRLVVTGKAKPADKSARVMLQRKVGKWRTIGRAKVGRGGRYNVSAPARSKGTWKVRILTSNGTKNREAVTGTMVATVSAPPKKKQPTAYTPPTNSGPTVTPTTYTPPTQATVPVNYPVDIPHRWAQQTSLLRFGPPMPFGWFAPSPLAADSGDQPPRHTTPLPVPDALEAGPVHVVP